MQKSHQIIGLLGLIILSLILGAVSYFFFQPSNKDIDTTQGIQDAKWSDNVTLTFSSEKETFNYQSNGIPYYGVADAYLVPDDPSTMPFIDDPADSFWTLSGDQIQETPIDVNITTKPTYTEQVTLTDLGQIGVAIDGARIFNDYEDRERQVVALNDNVIHDHAAFVDECNGHPLGDGTTYHYHGIPVCLSSELDQDQQHSFMIGVLHDGFPVYADKGENGETMTNNDLDECGGHFGPTPEFPEGIYHYHLTADEAPYSIDCYHGEIDSSNSRPGRPDFGAIAEKLGVSETEIRNAFGDGPPDFEQAAEALGISIDELRAVMPSPEQ